MFSEDVEIRQIDVGSTSGEGQFRYYQLLGHPGFVLLAPDGTELWKSQGEQSFEVLSNQIGQDLIEYKKEKP